MSIEQLIEFFKWMSIVNVGIFMISALLTLLMRKLLCKLHGKMFGISEEHLSVIIYCWLGMYKIMIIVFCLVPYLALILMDQ